MKALVKKDVLVLTKQMKIFLLLIVVMACVPTFSGSAFAVIYAALLPVTALGYDENSRWDQLAAMMPYSPAAIVGSKYLLGFLCLAGAAALTAAAQLLLSLLGARPIESEAFLSLAMAGSIAALMLSASLPFLFYYGAQKGRLFFVGIFALLFGAGAIGRNYLTVQLSRPGSTLLSAALLLPLFALAAGFLSYLLSVRLYRKRRW